jgi:L-malate glycosyltransferase
MPFVCCLRSDAGDPPPGLGYPHDILHVSKLASLHGIQGLVRARNWMRARALDLIVTFFKDANLVGTIGARLAGVPAISNRRNLGEGYWHTPGELRLLRAINRITTAYIANSEAIREYTIRAEGVKPDAIGVIPNAVDLDRFYPPRGEMRDSCRRRLGVSDGFLIGCVANLRPIKGIDVLLQAFAASDVLRQHGRLVLVGSGPEDVALRKMATELAIMSRVVFLGSREDVPDVIRALDVAVLCSDAESSPNAVLEYMATGLPIVATAVGGVPELLQAGQAGLVVEPRCPEALRNAIETLYKSPDRREALGQTARRRAETEFSPDRVVDCWLRFLEGVYTRTGSRARRSRPDGP